MVQWVQKSVERLQRQIDDVNKRLPVGVAVEASSDELRDLLRVPFKTIAETLPVRSSLYRFMLENPTERLDRSDPLVQEVSAIQGIHDQLKPQLGRPLQLRQYQEPVAGAFLNVFEHEHDRFFMKLPCGSGKSIVIIWLLKAVRLDAVLVTRKFRKSSVDG